MRSRESGGFLGITPFPLQPRSLGPLPKGRLLALKPVLENKCIPRPSNAFLYNSYTLVTPSFDLKFPQFKSPARGRGRWGSRATSHSIPVLGHTSYEPDSYDSYGRGGRPAGVLGWRRGGEDGAQRKVKVLNFTFDSFHYLNTPP